MHFYGFYQEWRKNPHWSISCCLALFLPLLSLSGEINDLAGTNVLDTQLETGHIEVTTVFGAVSDSGAIDVVLEEGEQDDNEPCEVQEDNSYDSSPHKQTRWNDRPSIVDATKETGHKDITLEHGEQRHDKQTDVHEEHCNKDQYIKARFHQATQTELSTTFKIANAVAHVPQKENAF